jgi:hypothetical protein
MIMRSFWQVLLVSFLSAALAVIVFYIIQLDQINNWQARADQILTIVDRYGLEDEINSDKPDQAVSTDTDITLNQIKNSSYSILGTDFKELENFRLTNGEYIFSCHQTDFCQIYLDISRNEQNEGVDCLIFDYDEDGNDEAVAILKLAQGGDDIGKYLALFDAQVDRLRSVDTLYITDDQIELIEQDGNRINLVGGDDSYQVFIENSKLIK